MDENKLKTIVEEVVNKAVDPIKEDLAGVKQDLSGVKETLEDHTRKLEALSGDMEQVLSEVKATHDEIGLWHQRDKREIDQIKKHLDLPLIPDIPQA
ncbi:MAG: hypothetical protein PHE48_02795 [Candidatus Daviesbacteria bacterium]|nr:hypothetical protein [Candidatus Daviesbacteria bacterium]